MNEIHQQLPIDLAETIRQIFSSLESLAVRDRPSYYTPPDIGRLLRVDPKTVRKWIRSCELPAINVASVGCQPSYRVSPDGLAAFCSVRQIKPPPRRERRHKVA